MSHAGQPRDAAHEPTTQTGIKHLDFTLSTPRLAPGTARGDFTMNALSVELLTSTDRPKRRQMFARMLQICEREDPAYIVLHQNASFTATRRDLGWRASPSFFLDFSSRNWTS